MITLGIIGCGHWGPNHIRVFSQIAEATVLTCADTDPQRLKAVKGLFPFVETTMEYRDILEDARIDAVCIATPTATHYALVKEALRSGKHVLCEKPLSLQPQECLELKALAEQVQKILMVGHVFLFNEGIIQVKKYLSAEEIGRVYYAHSQRTNLGPFRYDVNALWDLAPHDISIFNYFFDHAPLAVSARGQKYLNSDLEDIAFATLQYPKDILVNIHVSWLDPRKVRQITIVGDRKMIVWDDLDNLGPVKLYDKHVEKTQVYYETYGEFQLLSKEGSITIPKVGMGEPLKKQDQYFLDCVKNGRSASLSDAQKAYDVVRTLCAVQESIEKNGQLIKIS